MNYKQYIFILWLMIAPTTTFAVSLNQVKSVFLINFFYYTQWSERDFSATDSTINLCLMAEDEFTQLLELTVKDKLIADKPINIQTISPQTTPENCPILFISNSQAQKIPVYSSLMNTLIISDIKNSVHHGAMIELRVIDRKVKLFINLKLIKQANLSINSRLLSLATIIEQE